MARPAFKSVTEYLAAHPPDRRSVLAQVRAVIRKALPRAEEGISYGIPVYKVDGEMVLYFAGFQKHYSIYPATGVLLDTMGDELGDRIHNKASIHFDYAEKVPVKLITRIAKVRAADAKKRAAAKRRG